MKGIKVAAKSTSVLVVGGGMAGLSAAMFLAWHGVPVVLVEKHPGSSPHPRAMGFTTRTMELYRAVGLGQKIPQRIQSGLLRPFVKLAPLLKAMAKDSLPRARFVGVACMAGHIWSS